MSASPRNTSVTTPSRTSSTSKDAPRVKACDACRTLKLKCDAHAYDYKSCSRCRKMKRNCTISKNPRPRVRKTKADLEREVDMLRSQYEALPAQTLAIGEGTGNSPSQDVVAQADSSAAAVFSVLTPGIGSRLTALIASPDNDSEELLRAGSLSARSDPRPTSQSQTSPGGASTSKLSVSTGTGPHAVLYQAGLLDATPSDTLPRSLEGKTLDARKIDDCVARFFQFYAPALPGIFDSLERPNDLYEYSELLFWTIVNVGSRKSTIDPTIVESLMRPLEALAQRALLDPDTAISSIQAALLLCLWPLPISTLFISRTHAIAGAAMQLAIQKGLPFASRKQDFFGIPLRQSQQDNTFRARLWNYCIVVFQNNSLFDGYLPCSTTIDPSNNFDRDLSLFDGLPGFVMYKCRLHRIMIDTMSVILNTTDLVTGKNSDSLNSLIFQFDSEAQRVLHSEDNESLAFILGSARLLIRAFHFFSIPSRQRDQGIIQTYYVACELIETASRLDKAADFGSYCDYAQIRAVSLAGIVVLRVLRSSLGAQVNSEAGEAMYFEAIRLSKKHSVLNNDLDARSAIIATQLWSSTRAFQFSDGSMDGLRMLLRARLSLSVYFDAHWWWRAEFGGRSNPYLETDHAASADKVSTSIVVDGQGGSDSGEMGAMSGATLAAGFGDVILPDWDWDQLGDMGTDWF